MDAFDVVIVGSGTAGQTAALFLKEKGLSVAVVEKSDRPGGVCALAGCQAKKWFYEAAETIARSRHLLGKGISAAAEGDWSRIMAQKRQFTDKVPEGTLKSLEKSGIAFIPGTAAFQERDTLAVNGRALAARHIILATGARPMPLPIDGARHMITSSQFLELEMLPKSIAFIGGGFISFEFAHFAARIGAAGQKAAIFEVNDRPLGPFDAEMVNLLRKASDDEGIEVYCNVQIAAIEKVEKQGTRFLIRTAGGDEFKTDLVVHGAGRSPDLDSLALDVAGIRFSKKGIHVDSAMRTSNPRVFAVGDCAATVQLARVADAEATVAAENILKDTGRGDGRKSAMDYNAVPAVLFTYPQLAMIGKTEDALKAEGRTFRKSFAKNLNWPTYRRVGLEHAAYKILTDENNKISGAHILSDQASGLINTIKQAMINGLTADEVYRQALISPYPTRESDLRYMLKPLLNG
jgi:glutathione reductase (NADPH)